VSGANAIFGSDVVECGCCSYNPTWDTKGQRIGKLKCTAAGYALHVIAEAGCSTPNMCSAPTWGA
jgi:hypothetical protein